MKTKFKLVFAALLMLAAFRSHAQCGGNFYYFNQSPGTVYIVDSANYGLQVVWNFGDGDTANNNNFNLSHTYLSNGTYSICATVTNSSVPCTATYCDTVVINLCQGSASFGITQTGFGAYSFSPYTITPSSSFQWSFGDGGISTTASTTHNYAASGTYTVSLVVYDSAGGCSDTSVNSFGVSLCSFANNFSYDSLGTNPYNFTVASPVAGYTYTWKFGDGTTGSGTSATHNFTHYANYTTCLITSDAVTGCADSNCNTQLVDPCGIYANTSAGNNGLMATFDAGELWQGQNQTGLTYAWSFPGASPSTSSSASATVNYSTTGTYTATVIVANSGPCGDTLSQSVNITSAISYFTISGTVYQGSNPACGTVYLISQDTGYLTLLDSIVNAPSDTIVNGDTIQSCSGYFQFTGLPVDTYYVKAALNSNDNGYSNYLPTYYGNVLHWSGATPVILSNANANASINLTLGSNPGGPGFVSGLISQGAGMELFRGNNIIRGSGTTYLGSVQVNLLTSNDDPVAYTYSDASGAFRFNNLAYGSYKIYVEQLNAAVVPDTFSLSATNPADSTIYFTVDSNSVTTTGINNLNNISISGIFPNPVSTLADIEISSKVSADATLTLNDMLGQTVATQQLHLVNGLNKGQMNMTSLAGGVYQIVVQSNSERLTYKVIKAK